MRNTQINITRDDRILHVENWPSVEDIIEITSEIELEIQSVDNVTVLSASAHLGASCKDGICQLGEWKPSRKVA
jgi:hypothetical protein